VAALRPGGRVAFLVWQKPEVNEWFVEFREALAAGRDLPGPPVGAPGPFLLADPSVGERLLRRAGLTDIEFAGHGEPMFFGESVDSAYAFVAGMGFTEFMVRELDAARRAAALAELRASIARHAGADGVVYPSATWIVTARRP
jgi:hypothetical protein